ncbi:DUF397 domain-containing protein [Nocardia cyriacigeorgica]|jgi:hypothetical protein|uniref:DUF397 domain-containing protein n=1 Tax=Nocardia cyriacigeorgica TaxID=135487 RepID=UPI000CEA08D1|nr:DUF397 domain-containing protein [Nocardia cyriacigeorgica]MBF6321418.1 DUF397 domain-containing protein [Nocardia cyriacigeorgica]MBF6494906.1 DUF397 domain-containing protein [Nocardia cyriacigeorgica]PPJ09595.1 DUF397 domain-containing protein [Nocardia cyriacigeorgica]
MRAAVPESGWFKSTYSTDAAACVEVAFTPDATLVRDSKHPDPSTQPILTFTPTTWSTFLATLKTSLM